MLDEAKTRYEQTIQECVDFAKLFTTLCYKNKDDFAKNKHGTIKKAVEKLKQFEDWMKGNTWTCATSKPYYSDFHLYDTFDCWKVCVSEIFLWRNLCCGFQKLEPRILEDFPNLEQFCSRVEDLTAIKSYLRSERFIDRPLNNTMATFK